MIVTVRVQSAIGAPAARARSVSVFVSPLFVSVCVRAVSLSVCLGFCLSDSVSIVLSLPIVLSLCVAAAAASAASAPACASRAAFSHTLCQRGRDLPSAANSMVCFDESNRECFERQSLEVCLHLTMDGIHDLSNIDRTECGF
eukprot:3931920-Rhodomonas_salina.1